MPPFIVQLGMIFGEKRKRRGGKKIEKKNEKTLCDTTCYRHDSD